MSLELLIFEIASNLFGLPTSSVREVLRAAALFRLPESPSCIAGGLNLRGEIIPVLDGRALFALEPKAMMPRDHLIVINSGGAVAAIHVDRAIELIVASTSSSDNAREHGRFVASIVNTPRGATSVLDPAALVALVGGTEPPSAVVARGEA